MTFTSIKSPSYWAEQIRLFESSNSDNKSAFCKQNQLNYHQFLYWLSKSKRSIPANKAAFVPLLPSEPPISRAKSPATGVLCTFTLAGGHQINVYDTSVISALKSFVEVL